MSEQRAGIDETIEEILDSIPVKPVTEAQTISVEEAGRRLGISRMAAYNAVWRNQIPHIRVGRRLLIPVAKFNAMLGIAPPVASKGDSND